MFETTTVFEGEDADKARESLPVLSGGLTYQWSNKDYVEPRWRGGGAVKEIQWTLGKLNMVFRAQSHSTKGEQKTFTIADGRWGLSNGPLGSVSELQGLIINEVSHLITSNMDSVHKNNDVLWRSMESPEAARSKNEGKINALEVGTEEITMHVFKSGCYEKIVATGEKLSSEELELLAAHLKKHPIGATAWTTIGEEKWNPEGADGKTPNATYNFERMIKISDNCSLVWRGKHTNPSKPGGAFQVNDTLEIVRK